MKFYLSQLITLSYEVLCRYIPYCSSDLWTGTARKTTLGDGGLILFTYISYSVVKSTALFHRCFARKCENVSF